ncbi:MAG TPA: hypothetical protein VK453_24535 [Micromonosporaceae bacterium]|nr:hypothetical protein [Micromonosporaceae bacterium]
MDNTVAVYALIGAAMPALIAAINQTRWPAKVRGLVALGVCAAAAVVVEVFRGDLTWADWRNAAVVIAGSALAMHRLWWAPTGIAPTIEAATTIGGPPAHGAHAGS